MGAFSTAQIAENATRPRLSQTFNGGDLCDLTGTPRSARVHYECADENADKQRSALRIVSVTETSTCEYDIVVSSATACELRHGLRDAATRKNIDCEKA